MNFIFSIFEILKTFKKRNRLIVLSVINALLDIFSLASLFSLIVLSFNPEAIKSGSITRLNALLGFSSQAAFIVFIAIVFLIFFLTKTVASLWINKIISRDIFKISEDISSLVLKKYLMMSYLQFSKTSFSTELNKFVYLPFTFSSNLLFPALNLVSEGIILIILLTGMALFKISAFLVVFLLVAPIYFVYRFQRKKIERVDHGIRTEYPMLIKQALRIIESLPEIKSYRKDSFFSAQYGSSGKKLSQSFASHYTLQHQSSRLGELVASIGICVLIIYATLSQQTTSGAFMLIGLYAGASFRIIPSVNRILSSLVQMKSHTFILDEFKKLNIGSPSKSDITISFKREIELQNISFTYPERTPVIANLNVTITKGERIIITGRSGSGKTTLILLLIGLIKPSAGKILIDGVPIEDAHLDSLRELIGYVPQNPILLDATLAENIAFGVASQEIDYDRIQQLILQLDLAELVSHLPAGVQTTIGEKGAQLSGGQRQRITIARALYNNPEIILLDEITSHLDVVTEKEVILILKKLTELNKTIILISHQTNILQHFDRELIMENGQLIEKKMKEYNVPDQAERI